MAPVTEEEFQALVRRMGMGPLPAPVVEAPVQKPAPRRPEQQKPLLTPQLGLPERLRNLREKAGWTTSQLAVAMDVSVPTLQHYMYEGRQPWDLDHVLKRLDALELETEKLNVRFKRP